MKYALLVALREYAENAKTKGFWIGLLILPFFIVLGIQVPKILKKATPTRYFVMVDQSGDYGEILDRTLVRYQTRKKLEEFEKYMAKNMDQAKFPMSDNKIDLENMPAIEMDASGMFDQEKMAEEMVGQVLEDLGQIDALSSEAGWNAWVTSRSMFLKDDAPEFEEPKARFQAIGLPDGISEEAPPEEIIEALKPYLVGSEQIEIDGSKKSLFAALVIPENPKIVQVSMPIANMGQTGAVEYWSANLADNDLRNEIRSALNTEIRRRAYADRGVKPETVKEVEKTRVEFTSKNPKKKKGKEEVSVADQIRQWAPVGFVYLLFIAIMTVTQMLLNNTIEEKSNRIIEVLLSSVTPGELMMGKLLGIAAIGMTMTGVWILSLFAVHSFYKSPEMEFFAQIFDVLKTSNLLPSFAVYFLLGYLFYAGIFLSIGSLCNTIKDAQNFMGPVMVVMMVPLFTMMFIPRDPNGTLATFLSWIPLYTPFIMMNRAAADPPMFDLVGTLILMIVSAAGMLWLSGRIFRIGILRTGQPPKLMELIRWLRG